MGAVALAAALVGGGWLWHTAATFVAVDACLDAGGAWDERAGACRFTDPQDDCADA